MTTALERVEVAKARKTQRVVLAGAGLLLSSAALVYGLYVTVPKGNEGAGPVDALIVLGTPAGLHGEINPMQIWRVDEAVREFRAGRAPRIIFAGGPAANRYVEADVMAGLAEQQGVPASAILRERHSRTTLENIFNSANMMRAHGWNSVEVISSRQHLPRAAVLLEKTGLAWRVHAAPTPGWPQSQIAMSWVQEAVGTAAFRLFGTHAEPVLHAIAVTQQLVGYSAGRIAHKVERWMRLPHP